ncbi:hypothetical protein ABTY59_32040 [Streptomyces sp. NPDC096079]|uniref:hypothetical protein n=1 Tax=Streptomyces sp. NPDC096079 TaxID=3155820 RepID=UPI0033202242
MATATPTIPAVARLLALALPARRGEPWTVEALTAPGAPTVLSSGSRRLVVQADGSRVEVLPESESYPRLPGAVADLADGETAAVEDLTRRLLRIVLAKLDAAQAPRGPWTPDFAERDRARRVGDLTELGLALLDYGVMPGQHERTDGTVLAWQTADDGVWQAYTVTGHTGATLRYQGPLRGVYAVLPSVLRPIDAPAPVTSAEPVSPTVFTRYLTDRFPQMRPVCGDDVESGGGQEPSASVGLPDSPSGEHANDPVDDHTTVCAEFSVGFDLLLSAVRHLA